MPLSEKSKKIRKDMQDRYGDKEGERVFYATANKRGLVPETWAKKAGEFVLRKLSGMQPERNAPAPVKVKDPAPERNNDEKMGLVSSGGRPLFASNQWLMAGMGGQPDLYSGGHIQNQFKIGAAFVRKKLAVITGGATTGPLKNQPQGAQFVDWTDTDPKSEIAVRDPGSFRVEKEQVGNELRAKTAGEENEPVPQSHTSAPGEKMRPRAELVFGDRKGVYLIDKGDYILFPGGGISDGEMARDAAIRETLEECGRNTINVRDAGVIESVWPTDTDNSFWNDSAFDGERTYFFTGVDNGDSGLSHADREEFKLVPYAEAIARLDTLIENGTWDKANNVLRRKLVRGLSRTSMTPVKMAAAVQPSAAMSPTAGIPLAPGAQVRNRLSAQSFVAGKMQQVAQPKAVPQTPPAVAAAQHPTVTDMAQPTAKTAGIGELRIMNLCRELEKRAQAFDFTDGANTDINLDKELMDTPSAEEQIATAQTDVPDAVSGNETRPLEKVADLAQFLARKQYLQFLPDGRVAVRRLTNKRFTFPETGVGRSAPYEDNIRFTPTTGVPDPGYHGYDIGLNVGDVDTVPEGFEALPADAVLRDMYGSMGLAVNKPFRDLDRSRARAILRHIKKRRKAQAAPGTAAAPAALDETYA